MPEARVQLPRLLGRTSLRPHRGARPGGGATLTVDCTDTASVVQGAIDELVAAAADTGALHIRFIGIRPGVRIGEYAERSGRIRSVTVDFD